MKKLFGLLFSICLACVALHSAKAAEDFVITDRTAVVLAEFSPTAVSVGQDRLIAVYKVNPHPHLAGQFHSVSLMLGAFTDPSPVESRYLRRIEVRNLERGLIAHGIRWVPPNIGVSVDTTVNTMSIPAFVPTAPVPLGKALLIYVYADVPIERRGGTIRITVAELNSISAGADIMSIEGLASFRSIDPQLTHTITVEAPVLTVAVSPSTPKNVPAGERVTGAQFDITAESVRPGSKMLWRAHQIRFYVSSGAVSSLGVIQVRNAVGTLIKEERIIPFGNDPRGGLVFLEESDDGVSGYSVRSETLSVSFSTTALAGADIAVTSQDFVMADFGFGGQYGGLVHYEVPVSTTVYVQAPVPSGGGGGGGTVVVTTPEPRPPSELPGREIALQESPWYRRGSLPAGVTGWWCLVRLTEPLPENSVVWWDSEWSGQYPVPMVAVNGDGTLIGFPIAYSIQHLSEERMEEIGRVRVFELPDHQ